MWIIEARHKNKPNQVKIIKRKRNLIKQTKKPQEFLYLFCTLHKLLPVYLICAHLYFICSLQFTVYSVCLERVLFTFFATTFFSSSLAVVLVSQSERVLWTNFILNSTRCLTPAHIEPVMWRREIVVSSYMCPMCAIRSHQACEEKKERCLHVEHILTVVVLFIERFILLLLLLLLSSALISVLCCSVFSVHAMGCGLRLLRQNVCIKSNRIVFESSKCLADVDKTQHTRLTFVIR